jgi:hypothetical protein
MTSAQLFFNKFIELTDHPGEAHQYATLSQTAVSTTANRSEGTFEDAIMGLFTRPMDVYLEAEKGILTLKEYSDLALKAPAQLWPWTSRP